MMAARRSQATGFENLSAVIKLTILMSPGGLTARLRYLRGAVRDTLVLFPKRASLGATEPLWLKMGFFRGSAYGIAWGAITRD
jgi:hypothetical protein